MKNDISKLEGSRRCSICTQAWRPIEHGRRERDAWFSPAGERRGEYRRSL